MSDAERRPQRPRAYPAAGWQASCRPIPCVHLNRRRDDGHHHQHPDAHPHPHPPRWRGDGGGNECAAGGWLPL